MKVSKINNIPAGVKASIAFFISSFVTKGIAFVTTPFFTRMLTAEEYGQVSLYYTWYQLFGIIAMFCLYYAVFNVGMMDYPERRNDFSFSLLVLSNLITIIFSTILFLIYPHIKYTIGLDIQYIILMCIMYLFQPAYLFWVAKERYEYKYKYVLFFAIISALVAPIIAIISIAITPNEKHLTARIFGFEIPLLLIHLGFYFYLGVKAKWKLDISFWKAAIIFNLPLIPHYLSTYLLNSLDRIMIANIVNDSATAYYSLAYSIASIALIVWTAIDNSLVPYTFQKLKEGSYKDINKVANPLITLFACGCFMIIMFSPEAVKIMGSEKYLEAIYVIPPIVGGVFFQVQYFLYSNILYYYKKPKYVMVGSLVAVVFNLILNYIFINKYGYVAAGFTTLVCYAIQAFIDYLAMRIVMGYSVYDTKYIMLLSLVIIVVSIFGSLIYDYLLLRLIMVAVFIIIAFLFRKRIFNTFKIAKNKGEN